jgi:molybdenum cofactor cytidylyltransferase
MASSIRAGVAAARQSDAVIVCLGDMPRVTAPVMDRLIAAFNPVEHRSVVVPVNNGQFGNPVLWGAEHFHRLLALEGDRGARELIAQLKHEATEIACDINVLKDVDTPEDLLAMQCGL